jgi:hypothetical protein
LIAILGLEPRRDVGVQIAREACAQGFAVEGLLVHGASSLSSISRIR